MGWYFDGDRFQPSRMLATSFRSQVILFLVTIPSSQHNNLNNQSVVDSDIKWNLIWIAPTFHLHCQSAIQMISEAREIIMMRAPCGERDPRKSPHICAQFPAVAPDYQSAGHCGQLGVVSKRLYLLPALWLCNSWQWHAWDVGNSTTGMPEGHFSVSMIYKKVLIIGYDTFP